MAKIEMCANAYCSEPAAYWPGVCSLLCWAAVVDLPTGYCVPDAYDACADAEGVKSALSAREAENQ